MRPDLSPIPFKSGHLNQTVQFQKESVITPIEYLIVTGRRSSVPGQLSTAPFSLLPFAFSLFTFNVSPSNLRIRKVLLNGIN